MEIHSRISQEWKIPHQGTATLSNTNSQSNMAFNMPHLLCNQDKALKLDMEVIIKINRIIIINSLKSFQIMKSIQIQGFKLLLESASLALTVIASLILNLSKSMKESVQRLVQ